MRRVHWTVDLPEAHIVADLLRASGIATWVFDAGFVRQNWLASLAYGGYRVMVPDAAVADAIAKIGEYRSGALAIDEADDSARCPCCGGSDTDDPLPRRAIFLALIAVGVVAEIVLAGGWLLGVDEHSVFAASLTDVVVEGLVIPAVALHVLTRRNYRCTACGHRWHLQSQPYAELASAADAAGANMTDLEPDPAGAS